MRTKDEIVLDRYIAKRMTSWIRFLRTTLKESQSVAQGRTEIVISEMESVLRCDPQIDTMRSLRLSKELAKK